jgi:transketolase
MLVGYRVAHFLLYASVAVFVKFVCLTRAVGYTGSMNPAQELIKISNRLRADVLEMVFAAQAGHVAGPLSSADIFALLYFGGVARFDPHNPLWEDRDRIILSCGHYCPVQYAALARAGYFPIEELKTFMQAGSRLPGHPERGSITGIEVSTGPLGQGVSVATGMALGIKMKYGYKSQVETPKVFCIISDGELQEGQVWEAFNFAVRRQLDNLIFILDRNKIQIENYISQLATYGEVSGRLEAFGLYTIETDGHNEVLLSEALERAKKVQGGPAIVIANTVSGQGVSFMENKPVWHDRVPTKDELSKALDELGVNK